MGRSKFLDPQPGPAPTRRDSEEIVEAVVEATLRAGDPDLSINQIAELAGVGVASVYRYFGGKPAIYAEISRRLQRAFLLQLRALLARPELEVDEAIEQVCRLAVIVPHATPGLRRLLNVALPLSWSEENARETFEAAITEMTAWFTARVPDAPADLPTRMFVAFSATRGAVMMSQMMPGLAPEPEVLVQHLVACTRTYLGR